MATVTLIDINGNYAVALDDHILFSHYADPVRFANTLSHSLNIPVEARTVTITDADLAKVGICQQHWTWGDIEACLDTEGNLTRQSLKACLICEMLGIYGDAVGLC